MNKWIEFANWIGWNWIERHDSGDKSFHFFCFSLWFVYYFTLNNKQSAEYAESGERNMENERSIERRNRPAVDISTNLFSDWNDGCIQKPPLFKSVQCFWTNQYEVEKAVKNVCVLIGLHFSCSKHHDVTFLSKIIFWKAKICYAFHIRKPLGKLCPHIMDSDTTLKLLLLLNATEAKKNG